MKNKTIAIYSGEIPSTTFIERLIVGLAVTDTTIYLFGKQKKRIFYPKNVQLFTYSSKLSKLIVLLKYSLLLIIFKPKEKNKLDLIIAAQKGNQNVKRLKYYPVLYHKPDVFHLQWAKGTEDWLWVKDFGIKFILSLRGTHISISPIADLFLKRMYETSFHKVDGFHAVSKAILEEAKKYETNLKNTSVIYSGLELEKLVFKTKTNINSTLNIVSIGRSHWLKGYSYALDAFSILKQENFNFHYTIIGIDNDEELIFQRNQLDLDELVTFQKNIAFQKVMEQIYDADIILLPSIEEGIANVVLEAMALGTLVVSTDCGGMTEIVKNGKNGFIIPVRDSKSITDIVKKISSLSLENYNEITSRARIAVENQHSKDRMISDFESFYDKVNNSNKTE
ncbi:glycosyltransferase family 4 protein [uncultured Flavobacterium sp.]|uniref:glycosyltransferase family 4 protein n=1 Tax=uncultured Flavobacterium sp. TaxID=165435 RepID=UPI0030ECB87C|tara:strand:- start:13352 stop:14533 length:1182 start_codon:yes stop_codon:yes gene_type:complete